MQVVKAIALLPIIASSLVGQSPTKLTGQHEQSGTCSTCVLVAEQVTEFGRPNDSEFIPDDASVVVVPDGRMLVGNAGGGLILMYSPSGRYMGTLGRLGDGPGEYRNAKHMFAGPGDSLTLIGSNTFAVISTKTGTGRSLQFGGLGSWGYARLPDGSFLLNTTAGKHKAFTLLDRAFQEQKTFGPTVVANATGDLEMPIFAISASHLGGFWAAKREFVHRIERWSWAGTVTQSLDSLPHWFKPYSYADAYPEGGFRAYVTRPVPRTWAVHEQMNGQLWVLTVLPDRNWKPVPGAPQFKTRAEFLSYVPPPDLDRHLDTILEVFTAQTGRLIGSWRFHEPLEDFLGDGVVYSRHSDANGVNHIKLWKLILGGE